MFSRKVGDVFVVGETAADVEAMVTKIRRGEPCLGSPMRVRRTRHEGVVVFIDKEKRTARLEGVPSEWRWVDLKYA